MKILILLVIIMYFTGCAEKEETIKEPTKFGSWKFTGEYTEECNLIEHFGDFTLNPDSTAIIEQFDANYQVPVTWYEPKISLDRGRFIFEMDYTISTAKITYDNECVMHYER